MFVPPFCPNPACTCHHRRPEARWWQRIGYHYTACFGAVPRFRCLYCRKTFSSQTFSTDYYAKRKLDYRRLLALNASAVSVRALARFLGCSCGTILNRLDRLARQELACHSLLRPQAHRYEEVCIDGFVGFDASQYFPNNITISIAARSRFVLEFTHATLRRSGAMRNDQKKRREALYYGLDFEKKAIERSFSELLNELERDRPPRRFKPLVIVTDEKLEYERSLCVHPLFLTQDKEHRTIHHRVNSRLPRTYLNPLFPSNYLDREIRKDQAAHHRESTCFCRSVANGLSRMACYLGWHNYCKRFSVKAPVAMKATHAEMAGIAKEEIAHVRKGLTNNRAFLSLLSLDAVETKLWQKDFPTLGRLGHSYLPAFALR
jgi:transposase-like protein